MIINLGYDSCARSLLLQGGGHLIVAGDGQASATRDFVLLRYTTGGFRDTSFGSGGITITSWGNDSFAIASGFQSSGKIVLAGYFNPDIFDSNICAARYSANGALDASFGSSGKANPSISGQTSAMVVNSSDKIIIVGTEFFPADCLIVQLNADGSVDSSFGSSGKVVFSPEGSPDSLLYSISLQSNGKLIVAGWYYDGTVSFATYFVSRYNTDGSLDTGFGTSGVVGFETTTNPGVISVVVRNDDKVLVSRNDASGNLLVTRLNANGSVDIVTSTSAIGSGYIQAAITADNRVWGCNLSDLFFFSNLASNLTLNSNTTDSVATPSATALIQGLASDAFACGKAGISPSSMYLSHFRADGSLDASFGVLSSSVKSLGLTGVGG